MRVKILCGGTSYKIGDGLFRLALRGDVIDVTGEEAEALIASGAAEAVDAAPPVSDTPADKAEEGGDGPVAYSVDLKADQLRAIMEAYGLTASPRMTKREMVDALDAHFGEEDPPALNAEVPIV